jgi:adenylylsulfate kinase
MSGVVVWFTGLPSAGKTTLARDVQRSLSERGVLSCLLDSDELRAVLAPTLGYSDGARTEFYRALAGLAALLARQGLVVLVAATAHRREYRAKARALAPRFVEVWVTTSLDECQKRDDKGLYAAASLEPGSLPGVDIPYEAPEQAEVSASGGHDTWALEQILALAAPDTQTTHHS